MRTRRRRKRQSPPRRRAPCRSRWPPRSATFATGSARSRTSRRSPARWRWSPPRGCAAPSSGSRRCGPTPSAIRRMTRQAAEAAGQPAAAADPGRARAGQRRSGCCWSPATAAWPARSTRNIVRAGVAAGREHESEGRSAGLLRLRPAAGVVADASAASSRRRASPASPTAPPTPTPGGSPSALMAAYVDDEVDRVEIFYNGYISPISQEVRRETLLPLQQATILEEDDEDERRARTSPQTRARARWSSTSPTRRRSSAGSCPTTSRSRSTGRCSSRPPPSTARG